jgi:hypothetical protein
MIVVHGLATGKVPRSGRCGRPIAIPNVAAITADHLHRCPELPTGDVLVIGQPVWIHWRTADVVGARIGKRVADWENSHYFKPTFR